MGFDPLHAIDIMNFLRFKDSGLYERHGKMDMGIRVPLKMVG